MERLTRRKEDGSVYCRIEKGNSFIGRMAAIEDILGDDYDLDRLRELVEADREGRCVVFKFSLGSTIYRAWKHPLGYNSFVSEHKITTLEALANPERWRNAYPTREAAEAALKAN